MKKQEWTTVWKRIKDRFPSWQPTQVEAEDWCRGLTYYDKDIVENAGVEVIKRYSSNTPRLAWFIKICEQAKKDRAAKLAEMCSSIEKSSQQLRDEYEAEKERQISRLEDTSVDDLRSACVKVLKMYGHLISRPENGNPREWKQTLRGLVYSELYGEGLCRTTTDNN
jgi:hypothetical protein